MEYCGECPVCDDIVEFDESGFCSECGQPFHWGYCGGWLDDRHKCDNCRTDEEKEIWD